MRPLKALLQWRSNRLAALLFAASVPILGLGVISYWRCFRYERCQFISGQGLHWSGIEILRGRVYIEWGGDRHDAVDCGDSAGLQNDTAADQGQVLDNIRPYTDFDRELLGFEWFKKSAYTVDALYQTDIAVPLWAICLPLAGMSILTMRRRETGRCAKCGYDLRATPDRCPECGTIASERETPPDGFRDGDSTVPGIG